MAKLALFKMIDQFMYCGINEDGTEYFDDYCESAGEMAFSVLGFEEDRISKEEFYAAYDKLSNQIREMNGVESDSVSYLEHYRSEWKKKQSRSKSDILFEATERDLGNKSDRNCENANKIGTNYIINRDGTFEIYELFDACKYSNSVTEEYDIYSKGKLTDDELNNLMDILKEELVEQADNTSNTYWRMYSYAYGIESKLDGSIDGNEVAEQLANILRGLIRRG